MNCVVQTLIGIIESVEWQTLDIKISIKILFNLFCQMSNELVHRN